jgi:hypothetical protein
MALGLALCFGFPSICLGASTTMFGSAVVPFGAGAASVCDSAWLPRLQSSREAVPEAANIDLANTDFLPISNEVAAQFVAIDERGSACRRVRRTDFD